jgi:enoyl-CoA hydratase/carnithine racemase
MSDKVQFKTEKQIGRIILNRPDKLNALDPEMMGIIDATIDELERSHEIRVLVVEAAGEKSFCVGADILAWTSLSPLQMWSEWIRRGHRIFDRLAQVRQPVICAINGYAFGGGLELALACDLRIAADSARFAMPEVKLGTVPGWGGTDRLTKLVGAARAKQMIFSGESVTAEIAERWGIINEVVTAASLHERVRTLAEIIGENAPVAVQTAKQLIGNSSGMVLESLAGAVNAFTEDAKEGLSAFRERRSPKFEGR